MSTLRNAVLIAAAAVIAILAGQILAAPAGAAPQGPETVVTSLR